MSHVYMRITHTDTHTHITESPGWFTHVQKHVHVHICSIISNYIIGYNLSTLCITLYSIKTMSTYLSKYTCRKVLHTWLLQKYNNK